METIFGGVRILDLSNEFGVYCGKLFAGLGAEVIKVEKPGGDAMRKTGPFFHDQTGPETSLFFAYHNTGKKSITLELACESGRELFKALVKSCDAVIETYPVGYLDSVGLGYAALKEINPKVVLASITPFGQTGPYRDWRASSELIPYAISAPMSESGEPGRPPLQMGRNMFANLCGIYAATGVMAALRAAALYGTGRHLDISLIELGALQRTGLSAGQSYPFAEAQREGSQGPWVPGGLFPCKDGHFYIVGGRWKAIVDWMQDLNIDIGNYADPKYQEGGIINKYLVAERESVNALMVRLGSFYTKKDLLEEGARRKIALGPASVPSDVFEDEHYKARGYFVDVDHPVLGSLKYAGPITKLTVSPLVSNEPAPMVGQHNGEIFGQLGIGEKELLAYIESGTI